jgi:hypothetical protein
MPNEFRLQMRAGWEAEAFGTPQMAALVSEVTAKITALAIKSAPRRSAKKNNWNQIKKHIEAIIDKDVGGWYGNVLIEDDNRVRHAFLQDRGWTDRRGRRHAGRRFLKRALLKARIP